MLIDTHTHLYLPDFVSEDCPDGSEKAVDRAKATGVGHLILPNVDFTTVEPMRRLHDLRPEITSVAMGFHPTEVGPSWREDLAHIMELIADGSGFVAVGEIGMDLYWDRTYEEQQMQMFEAQVRRAFELRLPVIIHCREALPQTLEVLQGMMRDCPADLMPGVMHSFGGTEEDIEAVRGVGDFYFGINGIVTFKNSCLRDVLPAIGLDRILLETDSPYLAPVPHRGKRNESSFLPHVASYVGDALAVKTESVAEATTKNACDLFSLKI